MIIILISNYSIILKCIITVPCTDLTYRVPSGETCRQLINYTAQLIKVLKRHLTERKSFSLTEINV